MPEIDTIINDHNCFPVELYPFNFGNHIFANGLDITKAINDLYLIDTSIPKDKIYYLHLKLSEIIENMKALPYTNNSYYVPGNPEIDKFQEKFKDKLHVKLFFIKNPTNFKLPEFDALLMRYVYFDNHTDSIEQALKLSNGRLTLLNWYNCVSIHDFYKQYFYIKDLTVVEILNETEFLDYVKNNPSIFLQGLLEPYKRIDDLVKEMKSVKF